MNADHELFQYVWTTKQGGEYTFKIKDGRLNYCNNGSWTRAAWDIEAIQPHLHKGWIALRKRDDIGLSEVCIKLRVMEQRHKRYLERKYKHG